MKKRMKMKTKKSTMRSRQKEEKRSRALRESPKLWKT